MTEKSAATEQFTGLILLTGNDRPGIAASLFETLAPFAIHIIDIEQVVINSRLILTVLIGASPAHQSAIEEDLSMCASKLDVDIAILFAKGELAPIADNLLKVQISATKLHPQAVALVSKSMTEAGANIQSMARIPAADITIQIIVSGVTKSDLDSAIMALNFEDTTKISVNEK